MKKLRAFRGTATQKKNASCIFVLRKEWEKHLLLRAEEKAAADQWQREMKIRQEVSEKESRLRANTAARQQTSSRYRLHLVATLCDIRYVPHQRGGSKGTRSSRFRIVGFKCRTHGSALFHSLFLFCRPNTSTFFLLDANDQQQHFGGTFQAFATTTSNCWEFIFLGCFELLNGVVRYGSAGWKCSAPHTPMPFERHRGHKRQQQQQQQQPPPPWWKKTPGGCINKPWNMKIPTGQRW